MDQTNSFIDSNLPSFVLYLLTSDSLTDNMTSPTSTYNIFFKEKLTLEKCNDKKNVVKIDFEQKNGKFLDTKIWT